MMRALAVPAPERGLGGEHPADLALEPGAGLPHQLGVVDQTVLRRVVFRLQRLYKINTNVNKEIRGRNAQRNIVKCQGNYDIGFNEIKLLGFFHHLCFIKCSRSRLYNRYQCCGSRFIESGSSISNESGSGYGSRVWMTKNLKKYS